MPKSMQKPVSATFFQQTVIDLGYVDQNRKMIHESQVTNPTKDVIVISTSVKSCSCVGIELQKSRLQPGETISWALSWDSGSKKGPTQDVVQFIIENDT